MSRIHEALKKAEESRVTTPVDFAPVAVPDQPVLVAGVAGSVAGEAVPAFTSTGGADAMLSRCASVEWKPDPASMLFVNGNDGVRAGRLYPPVASNDERICTVEFHADPD